MKNLSATDIQSFAVTLHEARKTAKEIEPFSKIHGEYSIEDAYKVQRAGIDLRLAEKENIIGYKMGLTSKAKMEQMGLHTPIFGVLTSKMMLRNLCEFARKGRIHPKTEPEIYFVTNTDLSGSLDVEDVPKVCEKIGVALEILDSRYQGFKYFSLPDVIADNASSSHFLLGDSVPGDTVMDWPSLRIDLLKDDVVAESATGGSILGNPLLSLCELVKLLHQEGKVLPKGSIVLAGAATTAIPLELGMVAKAELEDVGDVQFRTV